MKDYHAGDFRVLAKRPPELTLAQAAEALQVTYDEVRQEFLPEYLYAAREVIEPAYQAVMRRAGFLKGKEPASGNCFTTVDGKVVVRPVWQDWRWPQAAPAGVVYQVNDFKPARPGSYLKPKVCVECQERFGAMPHQYVCHRCKDYTSDIYDAAVLEALVYDAEYQCEACWHDCDCRACELCVEYLALHDILLSLEQQVEFAKERWRARRQ